MKKANWTIVQATPGWDVASIIENVSTHKDEVSINSIASVVAWAIDPEVFCGKPIPISVEDGIISQSEYDFTWAVRGPDKKVFFPLGEEQFDDFEKWLFFVKQNWEAER